jgi:hypothetical protein
MVRIQDMSKMLYHQLQQIREQIETKKIKVSDALLVVFRYLRDSLPAQRLMWLNRELLGYRSDDLEPLYNQHPFKPFSYNDSDLNGEPAVPEYRFLTGTWGKLAADGSLVPSPRKHLHQRMIFCNIGIQQLETQIEELGGRRALFSMSSDASGAEFFCTADELTRIHEDVQSRLCVFITSVIEELNLASTEI